MKIKSPTKFLHWCATGLLCCWENGEIIQIHIVSVWFFLTINFSEHWFLYSGAYLSLFCVEYIFSWNDFSPLFWHHWFISTWMSYIHGYTSYLVFSLLCYCFYHIGHNWWKSSHLQGFCTGERLVCYSVGKMEKSFKHILYRYDIFLPLISTGTGLFIAGLMFCYCLSNIYCICSTFPNFV